MQQDYQSLTDDKMTPTDTETLPSDVHALRQIIKDSKTNEIVVAVVDKAVQLGYAELLEEAERYVPASYEQKLNCLKNAIQIGRNNMFDYETPLGRIYQELFVAQNVDSALINKAKTLSVNVEEKSVRLSDIVEHNIKSIIVNSKSVEEADDALEQYKKNITGSMVQTDIKHGNYDATLVPAVKEFGFEDLVCNLYEKRCRELANEGEFAKANTINQGLKKDYV